MKRIAAALLLFVALASGFYYLNELRKSNKLTFVSTTEAFAEQSGAASAQEPAYTPAPTPIPVPTPVPTDPPVLKVVAVGDIMLGRSVGKRLERTEQGYLTAFSGVKETLHKGDVVFANLEAPITESMHSLNKEKKIVLKASPKSIEALKDGGFNIFSLANNHIMDYYDTGLFDTMKLLEENNFMFSGAGKNIMEARAPAIIEKKGIKLALLSYTDMAHIVFAGNPPISFTASENKAGVAPTVLEEILKDIENIRSQVDLVAVSLHWGVEESFIVTPEQVEFAHILLDKGADMILGHHSHQFHGIEIYKGKPILYSLGNFIFDQNDPENMETFIVDMNFKEGKLQSLEAIPVRILDKCRAVIQNEEEAAKMLEREISLSGKLGTKCRQEGGKLVFEIHSP